MAESASEVVVAPLRGSAPRPTVTVVTVIRNGEENIERTLASVIGQDYPHLEYIVVDGGSTDGTVDVIRRHEHGIARWTSGPDHGPYDAMNRGAALATGQWIVFMNGGDLFAAPDVVSRVFDQLDGAECDVIYGDGIITSDAYRVILGAVEPLSLTDGNGFSHQSAFVRTAIQRQYAFDIEERIAADYDLFLRLYKSGKTFKHVSVVVSEFFMGGLSSISRPETIRLRHRVYKKHFPRSDLVMHFRLAMHYLKTCVRHLVPTPLWKMLKDKGRLFSKNPTPLGIPASRKP